MNSAFIGEKLVGALWAHIEHTTEQQGKKKACINTLGVLAPYRGYGIGTRLMEQFLTTITASNGVDQIYMHVQTSNEDAVRFYKRFGFAVEKEIENYYRRLNPPHCYLMVKYLQPSASSPTLSIQNHAKDSPKQKRKADETSGAFSREAKLQKSE
jgi:ribosomal protein S18 acetylase RimI-like enzyme